MFFVDFEDVLLLLIDLLPCCFVVVVFHDESPSKPLITVEHQFLLFFVCFFLECLNYILIIIVYHWLSSSVRDACVWSP